MTDLAWADAITQAALLRDGQVTAVELTRAAIDRAERLDPVLGLLVERLYDAALETAAEPDRRPGAGGPLAGAPMLMKDHLATLAGVRHTEGSHFLGDHVAAEDSELVRRYRAAGLVIIATASTPEFALMSTTEPRRYGPTRNPWDLTRSAGGSSGASAAAVAAGVVPIAHGNDSGGSLRIPASCCGVFGLKPSRARNSLAPHGDLGGIWAEHVITRSVRDSAAVLDAGHGPAVGDPYAVVAASTGPGSFLAATTVDPPRLSVAYAAGPLAGDDRGVVPECREAVESAADLCAALGHHVEPDAPAVDWPAMEAAYLRVFAAATAAWVDGWTARLGRRPGPADLEPYTRALADAGAAITAPQLLGAQAELQAAGRVIAAFFQRYDVLMTPTLAELPPPLGHFAGDPVAALERDARFTPFTWVANATGQPAASLPLHWTAGGLPVGVMASTRSGDEATLLALCAQLERARPWADRRPPVAAN